MMSLTRSIEFRTLSDGRPCWTRTATDYGPTIQVTGIPSRIPADTVNHLIGETTFPVAPGSRTVFDYYEVGIGKVINA